MAHLPKETKLRAVKVMLAIRSMAALEINEGFPMALLFEFRRLEIFTVWKRDRPITIFKAAWRSCSS